MTVSVSYSTVAGSGGEPIALPQSAGTISPGAQSSALDFYIYHDGSNSITNCRFYMLPYSAGVYLGAESAQDDYDKIIGWGDTSYPVDAYSGGGVYMNMNGVASYPDSSYQVFRTGNGDTLGNAITLSNNAVLPSGAAGEIPSSSYAHIKVRIDIPSTETSTGTLYFDVLMAYSATS
jgi:hypothetical protein